MATAELEGKPTSLPDGEQVLVPDEEANEAMLEDFTSSRLHAVVKVSSGASWS